MNAGSDPAVICVAPVVAMWIMHPPLINNELLIAVVLASSILLFWSKSSIELRRQMYDRLYGPGAKSMRLNWWETDLDSWLRRAIRRRLEKCSRNRLVSRIGNASHNG